MKFNSELLVEELTKKIPEVMQQYSAFMFWENLFWAIFHGLLAAAAVFLFCKTIRHEDFDEEQKAVGVIISVVLFVVFIIASISAMLAAIQAKIAPEAYAISNLI